MTFRNSFRNCVGMMFHQFKLGNYERLYIFQCETGKYYTLVCPDEITDSDTLAPYQNHRLTCSLSFRELKTLAGYEQIKLDFGDDNGNT